MRNLFATCIFVLAALLPVQSSWSATVTVRVTDSVGADRLPKILIIVRSLEGKGEITRGLTTDDGVFSVVNILPGLYQAISLNPYGYWRSEAHEFVVTEKDVLVEFRLKGSVIDQVAFPEQQITVRVVDQKGNAVPGAQVLGRDIEARFMRFNTTDEEGRAKVTIPCGESQISVIYRDIVITRDLKLIIPKETTTVNKCTTEGTTSTAQDLNIVVQLPNDHH
jgi:hypothetical protein